VGIWERRARNGTVEEEEKLRRVNVKIFLRAKFVLFVSVSNPTLTINGKCEEFFTQNTSAITPIYWPEIR